MIDYLGLIFLLALSLNMWALISVVRSGLGIAAYAIWFVVLLVPVVGFVVWYLIGPREAA